MALLHVAKHTTLRPASSKSSRTTRASDWALSRENQAVRVRESVLHVYVTLATPIGVDIMRLSRAAGAHTG
jgi:hypothetical protein